MLSNKMLARQILVTLLGSVARQIQAEVHDHNPRKVVPYTTPPHKASSTPTAAQLMTQGTVAFIHTKATGSQPIAEPGSEQNNGHGPYLTYKCVFIRIFSGINSDTNKW